jgi:hypothetical protein
MGGSNHVRPHIIGTQTSLTLGPCMMRPMYDTALGWCVPRMMRNPGGCVLSGTDDPKFFFLFCSQHLWFSGSTWRSGTASPKWWVSLRLFRLRNSVNFIILYASSATAVPAIAIPAPTTPTLAPGPSPMVPVLPTDLKIFLLDQQKILAAGEKVRPPHNILLFFSD